jgi:hypothetical protein
MKRIGQTIGFAGLFLTIGGVAWLKYVAFTWWSTGASLSLISVGIALAGIGGALFKRGGWNRAQLKSGTSSQLSRRHWRSPTARSLAQ